MSTAVAIAIFMLIAFFVLVFANVPITVCLGVASLATMFIFGIPIASVTDIVYTGLSKYALLAVPFFILAGGIMEKSGTSSRIIKFANCMVGPSPGGLAIVSIILTCFWGAISGNGPATVYALGTILIPAMVLSGYSPAFAAAVMAASSAISVVIPPSTTLIIYGVIAGQSISDLYMAGFLPGLFMGALFIVYAYVVSKKRGYGGGQKTNRKEVWKTFKESFWGLLTPVIILGGIYGGFVTPTEAAVVGCVYSIIIGVFVYKGIKLKELWPIFKNAAKASASLMIILGTASIFNWIITTQGIARMFSEVMMGVSDSKYILGFLVVIILLIAGCFLDGVSISYLFYPLLWPIMEAQGYTSIWFGVVLSMAIAVGMATPPVAVNIYPACNIAKITMQDITKEILGFVAMGALSLIIVLFVPQIITILPDLLKGLLQGA